MDHTNLPETDVPDQPDESGDPESGSPFDPDRTRETADVSSWEPLEPHDVTHEVATIGDDDGSSLSVEVASPVQARLAVTGPVLTDPLPPEGSNIVPSPTSIEAVQRMGGRRFFQGVLLGALVGALVAAAVWLAFDRFSSDIGADLAANTLNVRAVLDIIEPAADNFNAVLDDSHFVLYSVGPDGKKDWAKNVREDVSEVFDGDFLIWPPTISLYRHYLQEDGQLE